MARVRSCGVTVPPRASARGFDQLSLHAAGGDREHDRLDPHAGHLLGERNRLADRVLGFAGIDHRAGLDAARLDMADADHIDGVAAPDQRVARLARPQPADQAGDLAGADIEAGDQRRPVRRHRLASSG